MVIIKMSRNIGVFVKREVESIRKQKITVGYDDGFCQRPSNFQTTRNRHNKPFGEF